MPQRVKSVMPLATTAHHSPHAHRLQRGGASGHLRRSLYWANGDYYLNEKKPDAGLAVARMVGHITYLSEQSMHAKVRAPAPASGEVRLRV